MLGIYDDNGIRFEYPEAWEIDVSEDGPRTAVAVQSPDGPAFALVTVDDSRPEPGELADEALAAAPATSTPTSTPPPPTRRSPATTPPATTSSSSAST